MKKVNTAAAAAAMVVIIIIISNSAATCEAARVFKVGDDFGWQEPTNNTHLYSQWATNNRFQVGDSLLFEYKNDSVAQVEKWGYYHCNTSTATAVFDNGSSSFKLEQPGPFYFISGNINHCNNGQLLVVEVMSMHHHHDHPSMAPQPAFPPAYAYPPEGSSSSSSSSIVPSSSSESHQHSSAVIVSVIISSVTLVLIATFVALFLCAP